MRIGRLIEKAATEPVDAPGKKPCGVLSPSVMEAAYRSPAGPFKLPRRGHFFAAQSAKKRRVLIRAVGGVFSPLGRQGSLGHLGSAKFRTKVDAEYLKSREHDVKNGLTEAHGRSERKGVEITICNHMICARRRSQDRQQSNLPQYKGRLGITLCRCKNP